MKFSFKHEGNAFALGPFIKCPQPQIVEACALAGFDFVVIDGEHTPLAPKDAYPLMLAAQARNITPIFRLAANQEMFFKWYLDQGATYLQIPFVQTGKDALYAVEQSYFKPIGSRGLCRFVRSADYSAKPGDVYLKEANEKTKLIVQIEGAEGLANLDAILDVAHLDTVFIGPYDLSQSLGRPGEIWHKEVITAMEKIISKCTKKNMRVGTFTDTSEGVLFWAKAGVKIIEYGSDLNLFMLGCQQLKERLG